MPKIRLSKIYTRTGDGGETSIAIGRVLKTHSIVHAMGDVDETNSLIGLARTENIPADLDAVLEAVQHDLFNIGGELALNRGSDQSLLSRDRVTELESIMDRLLPSLPPLKEFILPGGSKAASLLHLARSVCRRAERMMWSLQETTPLPRELLLYMNRCSDLLFVLAREVNRRLDVSDVLWQKPARPAAES